MKLLKINFSSVSAFIRRERLYFLVLILSLSVFIFGRHSQMISEPITSPAVEELTQKSRDMEKSLQSFEGWIQAFEKNPQAVIASFLMLALFLVIFFAGLFILVLSAVMPRVDAWLRASVHAPNEFVWRPVILLRVLILSFAGIVASSLGFSYGSIVNPENENLFGLFHTLMIDFFVCFSIYAVLKAEGMSWAQFLGNAKVKIGEEIKRGITCYVITFPFFMVCLFLTVAISNWLHYEPPAHALVKIFIEEENRSMFVFQLALILAAFAAPIMEEIFFRGFCYRLFRDWWGVRGAMGISAAFFAGLHGSGFAFFPIFVLGLALAGLYEKRGSLTACWTFHILHNILFTSYFFSIKSLLGAFHG